MARHESDREDLFAELRSALPRWEIEIPSGGMPVVAGIRSEARFSVYFSGEQCYHFDAANRLRRAYVRGHLYRAQGETLACLRRNRTPEETQLLRRDLNQDELSCFLAEMRAALMQFLEHLAGKNYVVLRQESDLEPSLDCLRERLCGCLTADPAIAPSFPTRQG